MYIYRYTHTYTHTHTSYTHTLTHTHAHVCTHIGNVKHEWIKKKIEEGDGLPDMLHTSGVDEAIKSSGFEIVYSRDMSLDPNQAVSWYIHTHIYMMYITIYSHHRGALSCARARSLSHAP
jgi:hypothetical protein